MSIVISKFGSGPREPGAVLILPENGPPLGTVGGGLLEAKTIDASRAALVAGRPPILMLDLSDREVSEAGMICGGRVEILAAPLDGKDPNQRRLFLKLQESLDLGSATRLIGSILRGRKSLLAGFRP